MSDSKSGMGLGLVRRKMWWNRKRTGKGTGMKTQITTGTQRALGMEWQFETEMGRQRRRQLQLGTGMRIRMGSMSQWQWVWVLLSAWE